MNQAKISSVAELQMHQWLDQIQEYLADIEKEVADNDSIYDLDIDLIRRKLGSQYQLLQVLRDVATGKKKLVGIRRPKRITEDTSSVQDEQAIQDIQDIQELI